MAFTSNLRVSNAAPNVSNFHNKNSFFRVNIPSNEIFQSQTAELSISSISYPNRFKILPRYLNAGEIKRIFLYSEDNYSSHSIQDKFSSSSFSEVKDVSSDIVEDPVPLTSNLNKTFKLENIKWKYNIKSNQLSVSTNEYAYVLQIPCSLGNMLGMKEEEINFDNEMVNNHHFKQIWLNYNVLYTTKFIDIVKKENNLSIYELLDKNNFPSKGFFYLAMSYNDQFNIKNELHLQMHHPRYAFIYNNIIEDSIVDNSYYKILKTVYFEDINSRWKTISYKNDEYKKIQKTNPIYLEFSLRLPSGDLVEFEDDEDVVIINLKIRNT